ncbi:uncharacterized protein LOC111599386 [Drosophila hydei]|uniref:Uncharacterized protein LOC111599386 n=1 Tax=Drosophila hydei TaxID=7224 RepID=A0A6J1LSI1_DROHY|nr:uncharacterized protein LOC111599386 [Drosophila hydei]
MSDRKQNLKDSKGAFHGNYSDNEDDDSDEDEDEDEEAMQAALREMVLVPDIEPRQKHLPRRPEEPHNIGNIIDKLKKTASPETQKKWLKSVADVGIQSDRPSAEKQEKTVAKSKRSAPEQKPRKSETWSERMKKGTEKPVPSGNWTNVVFKKGTEVSRKQNEDCKQPKLPVYLQFESKPKLEPRTPEKGSKLERIEAASKPKSYFQIREQAEAEIAAIPNRIKEALPIIDSTDNKLCQSESTTGSINILTGTFRRSLNLEPSDKEPPGTKALPESKKTTFFSNHPIFGRTKPDTAAGEKSTAEAASQDKRPLQKSATNFFANLTSFKKTRPAFTEDPTDSINITSPQQIAADSADEFHDVESTPVPSTVLIDAQSTSMPINNSMEQTPKQFDMQDAENDTQELGQTEADCCGVTYNLIEKIATLPDFLRPSEGDAEGLSSSETNPEHPSFQEEKSESTMKADQGKPTKFADKAVSNSTVLIWPESMESNQNINPIRYSDPDVPTQAARSSSSDQMIEAIEQLPTAMAKKVDTARATKSLNALSSATKQLEEPIVHFIANFSIYGRNRPTPIKYSQVERETVQHDPLVGQVLVERADSSSMNALPDDPLEETPVTSSNPSELHIDESSAEITDNALIRSDVMVSSAKNESGSGIRQLVPAIPYNKAAHSGSSGFISQPRTLCVDQPVADKIAVERANPTTSNSLAANLIRYFFPMESKSEGSLELKNVEPAPMQPCPNEVIIVPPQLLKDKDHKSRNSKKGKDKDNDKNTVNGAESTAQPAQLEHSESMRTLTIVGRHSHITTTYRDHCHYERHDQGVDKIARRKLIIASALCVSFMICEIIGGILSRSLAIATDAAHLLTDLAGFLISLFALYLSARPSSQRMNFGWYRAEVIGAMLSVYFIWVITGILVYMAVDRLITGKHDVDAKIMLITSALAILVNVIMALQLGHGHSHGLGKSHGHSHRQPRVSANQSKIANNATSMTNIVSPAFKEQQQLMPVSVSAQYVGNNENINVRAAYIHVVGDMIQSFGVFLAALIIFFKPEWAFVDSICTFIFSVIVLLVTFRILRDVLMVLMEATPDYMDYGEVQRTFLSIEGVEHVHNLRIWALSINKIALSAHLAIRKDADPQIILEMATTLIHKRYNFFETTIQIEEYTPGMEDCNQCMTPLTKASNNDDAKIPDDKREDEDIPATKDEEQQTTKKKRVQTSFS